MRQVDDMDDKYTKNKDFLRSKAIADIFLALRNMESFSGHKEG
jgi:hypothetical protein